MKKSSCFISALTMFFFFVHFNGCAMIEETEDTLDTIVSEIAVDMIRNTKDTPFTVKKDDLKDLFGVELQSSLSNLLQKQWDEAIYQEESNIFRKPSNNMFFKFCNHALSFIWLRDYQDKKWDKNDEKVRWLNNVTHNLFMFGEGNFEVCLLRFFDPFLFNEERSNKTFKFSQYAWVEHFISRRNFRINKFWVEHFILRSNFLINAFFEAYIAKYNASTDEKKKLIQGFVDKAITAIMALVNHYDIDLDKNTENNVSEIFKLIEDPTRLENKINATKQCLHKIRIYPLVPFLLNKIFYKELGAKEIRQYLQPLYDITFLAYINIQDIYDDPYISTFILPQNIKGENVFTVPEIQSCVSFVSFINAKTKEHQDQSNLAWFLKKVREKQKQDPQNISTEVLMAIILGATMSIKDAGVYQISEDTINQFNNFFSTITYAPELQYKLLEKEILKVIENLPQDDDLVSLLREKGIFAKKVVARQGTSYFSRLKTFVKSHPYFFLGGGVAAIVGLMLAAKYKKLRLPAILQKQ